MAALSLSPESPAAPRILPARRCPEAGFSLVELLLVLVIVGILALVAVNRVQGHRANAVRSVLDELEGTLAAAHMLSVATGRDVTIATTGSWTSTSPLLLAYGTALTGAGAAVSSATILANGATAPEAFRFLAQSRDHMAAGIVVTGTDWWTTAATGNTAITAVTPFSDSSTAFNSLLSDPSSDAANLTSLGSVKISGTNNRFNTSFYIAVVGLASGGALPGGPMGLLVGLKNGATIYKFYNSGSTEGTNTWTKL